MVGKGGLNIRYTLLHLSNSTSLILSPSRSTETAGVYTCAIHFILVPDLFLSCSLMFLFFFFITDVHLVTCAVQLQ